MHRILHIAQSYLNKATVSDVRFMSGKSKNAINTTKVKQDYDYFLVLDFEATCERNVKLDPQEIIEFPCLKLNSKTMKVESIFHQYVKPRFNPILTPFCIELTGILQEMVDNQPYFERCFELFHEWIVQENLLNCKFTFVTCGDWDLKMMLPNQCRLSGLVVPSYMKQWINIKKTFAEATGKYGHGLNTMLRKLDLGHEGRLHSGIDDCKNIANIVRVLAEIHPLSVTGHAA